ncbi:MAG: class I SAM-dependent methyltransferase [Desulfovermiculus sp.]|nr:class I SAM-dependent methyltransferase [Desulfovermiculus sp.]
MNIGIRLAESGGVPDFLLRHVIRMRHRCVLRNEDPGSAEARQELLRTFVRAMQAEPIAAAPLESNRQHYEVPPAFFARILGPRLKYSSCLWPDDELGRRPHSSQASSERRLLGDAEEAMLQLTAQRAEIRDGMRILDLGCGWGSFALWAAEQYPQSRILAVSNSQAQGAFILDLASKRSLSNIHVVTADMNDFTLPAGLDSFHRVISVEMFEHMANWPLLLGRIAQWLTQDGLFFMHIFVHKELAYPFRSGPNQWMTERFFSGGIMPSDAMPLHLQHDVSLVDHWRVSGLNYARTLESWLCLLDAERPMIRKALAEAHGSQDLGKQIRRWRIFLMACSELFAFSQGNEWFISHYLMSKRRSS